MKASKSLKRIIIMFLLLDLLAVLSIPLTVRAEESEEKVVRVGWFDSSFCYWDQFGRRCGIDYEYRHKISAYTGWTYEYVEDSWPNLFQMLKDGEIDLLSDVSFKPERADYMLFPDLPMGTESYYIYIDAKNREITADNLNSFNGKRIGVNQGSVQEGFLSDWAERNNVDLEIVPLVVDEDESMDMVTRGELDGYASIYSFSSEQKVLPVCRVGSSDYFYAVNKNRPDLLAELNMALSGIQDEDPYFNQRLTEERLYNTRTNAFLTPNQEDWIAAHGTIRIGYRDNYLPFCASDKQTGELTGALKDYLAHAQNNLRNTDVSFAAIPFDSVDEALEALKNGTIDCVFPIYLGSYDSDQLEVRLTNPAMKTEMNALMRGSNQDSLSRESVLCFAVPAGDPNIVSFIMDQYPNSTWKTFESIPASIEAVSSGVADSALVSNYRLPSSENELRNNKLITVPTGESIPFSFAVNNSERELYFLLNKISLMTRSEDMDSALASYMLANQKVTFIQFLRDNWIFVVIILFVIFFLIVLLLILRLNAQRKLNENQKLMEESLRRELLQKEQLQSAMDLAYKDTLTGVKSKHAYKEAEERMDKRIEEGTAPEFSVAVFDLNDLKLINDSRGHEIGDEYIRDACKLICDCFKRSPVFRIGGDEFTAILEGSDHADRERLLESFRNQVLTNLEQDGTVVAVGCSSYECEKDKNTRSVFERADALMYKEKLTLKNLHATSGQAKMKNFGLDPDGDASGRIRKKILIADDVEINREILGDLLEEDYDILYASDGVETLEILRSHKDEISLLLLDLYMPNMTGQEVMAEMQLDEDLMAIPIIVLTIDQNAEVECLNLGAMDFIPKPYPDIEIIKARISKCIRLSENRGLVRRRQRRE